MNAGIRRKNREGEGDDGITVVDGSKILGLREFVHREVLTFPGEFRQFRVADGCTILYIGIRRKNRECEGDDRVTAVNCTQVLCYGVIVYSEMFTLPCEVVQFVGTNGGAILNAGIRRIVGQVKSYNRIRAVRGECVKQMRSFSLTITTLPWIFLTRTDGRILIAILLRHNHQIDTHRTIATATYRRYRLFVQAAFRQLPATEREGSPLVDIHRSQINRRPQRIHIGRIDYHVQFDNRIATQRIRFLGFHLCTIVLVAIVVNLHIIPLEGHKTIRAECGIERMVTLLFHRQMKRVTDTVTTVTYLMTNRVVVNSLLLQLTESFTMSLPLEGLTLTNGNRLFNILVGKYRQMQQRDRVRVVNSLQRSRIVSLLIVFLPVPRETLTLTYRVVLMTDIVLHYTQVH